VVKYIWQTFGPEVPVTPAFTVYFSKIIPHSSLFGSMWKDSIVMLSGLVIRPLMKVISMEW
jgi:hypothetical protein